MRTIKRLYELSENGELTQRIIDQETKERWDLVHVMVGRLYPSIVQSEIAEIQQLAKASLPLLYDIVKADVV